MRPGFVDLRQASLQRLYLSEDETNFNIEWNQSLLYLRSGSEYETTIDFEN